VAADEELTFDYNFERYGDNPIKCYCGTKKCGGWIGGGQKDGEDGDDMTKAAADEDPEDYYEPAPVMLEADESEIAEEETRGREARARARG
jgi:histone-lysine N-methyltransferase SETD2